MLKKLLVFLLLTTALFAAKDLSLKKVKFFGELKEQSSLRVSIKDIEKLGYHDFVMEDPHLLKGAKFGGVFLKDFAAYYGKASLSSIVFTAIDGYEITISKEEWQNDIILLATKYNDEYTSFKTKGPLRIVYPKYNSNSKKYSKNLINWIWMIKTIEFK